MLEMIFRRESDDSEQKEIRREFRDTGAAGTLVPELVFPADPSKRIRREVPYTGATGTVVPEWFLSADSSTDESPYFYFDFTSMIKDVDQVLEFLTQLLENDEDTDFNGEIYNIIVKWGVQSINRIISLIKSGQVRGLFISKLLQSLGDIVHPHTHLNRRSALESFLFDNSARVRDGACLGLSVMNDASSLPYVIIAEQNENIPTLKRNLQSLIIQLQHGKEAGAFYTRST